MQPRLRHRLLADAVVASHDHPANVERGVALGMHQLRRRVARAYTISFLVWALLVLVLMVGHAPSHSTLPSSGAPTIPATISTVPAGHSFSAAGRGNEAGPPSTGDDDGQ